MKNSTKILGAAVATALIVAGVFIVNVKFPDAHFAVWLRLAVFFIGLPLLAVLLVLMYFFRK